MDRVRVSVWDLERMVMEIGFESEWVYVSLCVSVFQKTKFNFPCGHLLLKGTVFLTVSCLKVLLLRNRTESSREEINVML